MANRYYLFLPRATTFFAHAQQFVTHWDVDFCRVAFDWDDC